MSKLIKFAAHAVNRISACLPPTLGRWLRNRSWPSAKPTLRYLEFHITDHCNMNCGGCTHFAPMADKRFADVAQVAEDFARLRTLFRNITEIHVMGGEPLLHHDCPKFLRIVREAFPSCRLSLVTNGLLLAHQNLAFWETCRETRATIMLSVYPPIHPQLESLVKLCGDEDVPMERSDGSMFIARCVPSGDVNMRKAFRHCRGNWFYCPILKDGRIYNCAMGCYASYWNRAGGAKIPEETGIALESATGPKILDYLMHPVPTCAYCSPKVRRFPWRNSGWTFKDWLRD